MALGGAAWRNETRAWRRAMLKTPRPNTDYFITMFIFLVADFLFIMFYTLASFLKQKFTQYPAIHTNYSLSNCTISNKKDFNRSSDFLVFN